MSTIHNVPSRIPSDPPFGPKDWQPVDPLVCEIIRRWREQKAYLRTEKHRPFPEVLACFHIRMIQGLHQSGRKAPSDTVSTCVEYFCLYDCPAQETIQLQVTVEGLLFQETQKLLEEKKHMKDLNTIKDSIVQIQAVDSRRMHIKAEILHAQLMDYLITYSGHLIQHEEADPVLDEAEILAGLESVLPRKGLLHWMELPDKVKLQQLEELAEIVTGIRVYNKHVGKGGTSLGIPYEQFEKDWTPLLKEVEAALTLTNDRIDGLTAGALLYVEEYGVQHVFIQRLKDDLAYSHQSRTYLQALQFFLLQKSLVVTDCHEKSMQCVDAISKLTTSRKCVPGELVTLKSGPFIGDITLSDISDGLSNVARKVFPNLRQLGKYHKTISDDYKLLQAHLNVATNLFNLIRQPDYVQFPSKPKKLEIKAKNFLFLPKALVSTDTFSDNIIEQGGPSIALIKSEGGLQELKKYIQYGGFCAVHLVRYQGLLVKGDPQIGLLKIEDKIFSFADDPAMQRFLKAPQLFIKGVYDIALKLPYLIHVLGLNATSTFSFVSIPLILQIISNTLPNDFGVQTSIHSLPIHTWDEETLLKRVETLKSKRTDSNQTCLQTSHFHRESISQVWPPKDKWTQTGVPKSTCMPRYVSVLHNLRGELHQEFKVIKSSYEWP